MGFSARPAVALETTLLVHGVPRDAAPSLAARLREAVARAGAQARVVGVVAGRPVVGMTDEQVHTLLESAHPVRKVNTGNLGVAMFRGEHAATTVSATMELAARAGVHVFATGGIGGVHRPSARGPSLDVSADLTALTRFPVAVVASGVKSILDIAATREMLEALGVPVIGFRTDAFPAFYLREWKGGAEGPSAGSFDNGETDGKGEAVAPVDARFDDPADLARFVRFELARTGRAVLICNPIPPEHEIARPDWDRWLAEARRRVRAAGGGAGRDATPALLTALHEASGGATLRANIELACANAALAAQLAVALAR